MNKKTKARKRREAAERQGRWDALSRLEKVAVLAGRPGGSMRQMHRLSAQ